MILLFFLLNKSEIDDAKRSNKNATDPNLLFYNYTAVVSPLDELKNLGITLMRGIQTVNDIEDMQNKVKRKVYFSNLKIDDNKIYISNISFAVKTPDEYALIFGINGIFTDFTVQEWYITVLDNSAFIFRIFDFSEIIILSCFYLVVLMLSAHMIKGYWMIIPIIATAVYMLLISLKSYENQFYIISVYFFTSLVLLFIVYSLYVYLIDYWIRNKEPNYFYNK